MLRLRPGILIVCLAATLPARAAFAQTALQGAEPVTSGATTDGEGAIAPTQSHLNSTGIVTYGEALADPTLEALASAIPGIPTIDVPLNGRVMAYIELFTGRFKSTIEDALSRGARYLPMIQDVLRAEGLPLDLAYVPIIESRFRPDAVSPAQARGLWQIMRETGRENGLKHDWYVDERAEPEKATRAAAKYLKTLYRMFGDWHLALASYNGGPARVRKAVKDSGKDDFWSLSTTTRYLPRETRDYVPLILAAVAVARNPAQYGVNIRELPLELPPAEVITLPRAIDLRKVAEWAGTPAATIQKLNPALRRWTTPVRSDNFELRVPQGSGAFIMAKVAESESARLDWHTVKPRETLASIAKRLKVSSSDLAQANYLPPKSAVRPGQQLVVPRPLFSGAPRDTSDAVAKPAASRGSAKAPRATKMVHRVREGDTLTSIARRYNASVDSIRSWNQLRGQTIKVGDVLTVFRSPSSAD